MSRRGSAAQGPPATDPPTLAELATSAAFRRMAASTAVAAVGNGVFAALSFLYLTRMVALPASTAGAGLTVAGLLAVVVGVPVGRILDRTPVVTVNAVILLSQAAAVAWLASAGAQAPVLLAAGLVALASKLKLAARGTLVAVAFDGPHRQAVRAWLRSLSNLGIALGSGLAVGATAVDHVEAYRLALLAVAATYVVAAALMASMRGLVPERPAAAPRPRRGVMRDARYLIFCLLNGLLGVHYLLVEIGVPMWTEHEPGRAGWLISAGLIVNTLVVVTGQVPVSHRIDGVDSALRAQVHAGILFALAAAGIFAAGALETVGAAALVLASVAVYSVGEIMQAAASWELSFELADPARPGEYQGVFASGANLGPILAPILITSVLTGLGDAGWPALGLALCGLAAAHLILRAPSRPAEAELAPA